MKQLFLPAAAALLLAGCQQGVTVRDVVADTYLGLEGAQLVLQRDIPVTPGRSRVFLQDGGPSAHPGSIVAAHFDSYRPHCALEIERVDHAGVQIRADTFLVTRVQRSLTPVVGLAPRQYAAVFQVGGLDGADGSSAYYDGFHFWLASERQPEVRRLTCYGVYAEPHELYPPTLQEIRQALGDVAELRL